MVITDIVRGLVLWLLEWCMLGGHLSLAMLYASYDCLFLSAVALFDPASAAIPGMVKREELTAANARNNFSRSATGIIGPALVLYSSFSRLHGCFHHYRHLFSSLFCSVGDVHSLSKQELGTSQGVGNRSA